MLAHEAHYEGEPCWHVCQYYDRLRARHKEKALKRATPSYAEQWRRIRRRERLQAEAKASQVFNPVRDALMIDRAAYKKGFV